MLLVQATIGLSTAIIASLIVLFSRKIYNIVDRILSNPKKIVSPKTYISIQAAVHVTRVISVFGFCVFTLLFLYFIVSSTLGVFFIDTGQSFASYEPDTETTVQNLYISFFSLFSIIFCFLIHPNQWSALLNKVVDNTDLDDKFRVNREN